MDQDPGVVTPDITSEVQPVSEAQNRPLHYSIKTIVAAGIVIVFLMLVGVALARQGLFLNNQKSRSLISPEPVNMTATPSQPMPSATETYIPTSPAPTYTPPPVATQPPSSVTIIQSTIPPSYPTTSSNGCPRAVEPPCTNDKLPAGCGYSAMPIPPGCPGECPIICN